MCKQKRHKMKKGYNGTPPLTREEQISAAWQEIYTTRQKHNENLAEGHNQYLQDHADEISQQAHIEECMIVCEMLQWQEKEFTQLKKEEATHRVEMRATIPTFYMFKGIPWIIMVEGGRHFRQG